MHLAIRTDGGPEIGYGHLIRSKSLAEEFLIRDHEVTVATSTTQQAQSVFPDAADIIGLPSRANPEPFTDWLDANSLDAVFSDSYTVNTEYQCAIRDRVPLSVLQDDDNHAVCADLFVNGNLYASDLDYEFVGQNPRTCLGADYILLRTEIREQSKKEPPWRKVPKRALVSMGGSDIANLTPTVIRAFDEFDTHVDAIVGPGFSDTQVRSIRAAAEEISTKVFIARDPEDLVERMFQADFAVSTSSSTTYELLALGTPIVSVPVAENQEPIARSLRERDAANVLNREANIDDFRISIETYTSSPNLRRAHRNRGKQLVDGHGAERIYAEILSIVEDDA